MLNANQMQWQYILQGVRQVIKDLDQIGPLAAEQPTEDWVKAYDAARKLQNLAMRNLMGE